MSEFEEPSDNLEECDCTNCKNVWWVPYYDGLPDMGHPKFCPFCGVEFGSVEEMV
jgi:hypothetical protein